MVTIETWSIQNVVFAIFYSLTLTSKTIMLIRHNFVVLHYSVEVNILVRTRPHEWGVQAVRRTKADEILGGP